MSRIRIVHDRAAALNDWKMLNAGSRMLELGEVRLATMCLLEDGPRHGYGVMKDLRERLGPDYSASAGSVYPALKQLESEGLVSCKLIGGRKEFTLTRAGRRSLKDNPAVLERIRERIDRSRAAHSPTDGDVPTLLQGLLRAAYAAAGASVGQVDREMALRDFLSRMARELEAFTHDRKESK